MPKWTQLRTTEYGGGKEYNFILSNGDKTKQPASEGYSFTDLFKLPLEFARVEKYTMHDSGTRTYTSLAGAAALLSATSCGHTSAESRAELGL